MLRTLHGKLSLLLLVLFIPVGVFYVWSTVTTSRRYAQEVSQKVGAGLAARLVREHHLMVGQDVDPATLMELVETLAMTNPDVDLYVLDPEGRVVEASLPLQRLERRAVSPEPIERFLGGAARYPILGDNPRALARLKVFSVAPIPAEGPLEGYLYVVLADEVQDTVAAMVESSTIVRLSVWVGLTLLSLVFLAGTLSFTLFTRRLKRLATIMMDFQARDFTGATPPPIPATRVGDEIADLNRVFYSMAARIAEQVATLKESDRLRRELVANVSHDLRTPLTALQGYLETLHLETLSTEEKRRYLGAAMRQSTRLGALVTELFELAKLEANAATLNKEIFPLAELVQDVVQKFELSAEGRGVALHADTAVYPFVHADVGFLERVLENLIDNALRYTPGGGVVRVSLAPAAEGVVTTVSDTGAGIPSAELPHIFERYYRASRTAEETTPLTGTGAGLGLAISQRMLELHGSRLEVRSDVGVGTTFSFSLATVSPQVESGASPSGP